MPGPLGCLVATDAHVYPDRNLLLVQVVTLSPGKGPGLLSPPRFFEATTLDELTDLAAIPPIERVCKERLILAQPVDGRVYRDERYSRYVFYNNLLVYDLDGILETWRDGLSLGITNPNTGQVYVRHGDDTLVLDLEALSPVGALPPVCIQTLDVEAGRIYALDGRDLVVYSERGARPTPQPTGDAGPLLAGMVLSIQPSPDYARDRTLFLTTSGKLYRSTDSGQTWAQLRGGLPEGSYLTLDLAISPDFAADRTLFVGGFRSDFWGEGVYRSTDGGNSWRPMWGDLTHLRVYDVSLSPNYAADGTLLAYSRYQRLIPWESGLSLFRSTDEGLSWTLVMTQPQDATLPLPQESLPLDPAIPAVQFRETGYGQAVERTVDDGQTWEPFQQNLPITPITDMAITGRDLVVATQGRSFWILDDLTPLHSMTPEIADAEAHLFQPRTTYRFGGGGGFGSGGSGSNPPTGVILYYLLGAEIEDELLPDPGPPQPGRHVLHLDEHGEHDDRQGARRQQLGAPPDPRLGHDGRQPPGQGLICQNVIHHDLDRHRNEDREGRSEQAQEEEAQDVPAIRARLLPEAAV